MTSEHEGRFTPSSKANPCPICDRTKDGDCRTKPGLALCHSKIEREELAGWQWLEKSKDGNWGVWVVSEKQQRTQAPQLKKHFVYPTRNGGHLVQVVRTDRRDGTKTFSQRHFKGAKGGFVPGLPAEKRKDIAIYRYSEVREAIGRGEPIYWVEGEQTADALWKAGLAATTSIGGTGGFENYGDYSKDLDGATVIACPDRDRKGVEYADKVAKFFGATHWCRFGPASAWKDGNLPEKGGLDLYDWIEQGATVADIEAAVKEQGGDREFEQLTKGYDNLISMIGRVLAIDGPMKAYALNKLSKIHGTSESKLLNMYLAQTRGDSTAQLWDGKSFMAEDLGEDEFLIHGLVPRGGAILVTAAPGAGKSSLVYAVAKSVLSGCEFDGRIGCKGKVLILQSDEGRRTTQRKLRKLGFQDLDGWEIHFGYDFTNMNHLERWIQREQYDLIICDSYHNLNRFSGFEEKDTGFAAAAMEMRQIGDRIGCTFMFVHHLNHRGTTRGTTALEANVDEVWRLTKESERSDSQRHFTFNKSRSELQGYFEVEWNPATGEIRLTEVDEDDDKDRRAANVSERLLLQFRHNKGIWYEVEELADTVGATAATVQKNLSKLCDRGNVVKQRRDNPNGGSRSWKYVYGIPSPPSDSVPFVPNVPNDMNLQVEMPTNGTNGTNGIDFLGGGVAQREQQDPQVQAGGDPIPDEVMHGYLMAEDSLLPREDALFKQGVSTANDNPDDWEDLK